MKDDFDVFQKAFERLNEGFKSLPEETGTKMDKAAVEKILLEVADRLHDNYPYFHPLYAGQMLKPPHPLARQAYALAMHLNPNNHALDGGRASSAMEKEAVAEIALMFGWKEYLGHLTGGGTMANLEALWVAGQLNKEGVIAASSQAHYTHSRITAVLGLGFESIPCDNRGRMDIAALKEKLEKGLKIGTVVATIGTTATGSIDPLPELLELRKRFGFRIHADAAYGGYFTLVDNLTNEVRRAYDLLGDVDSLVIDPHKHGLQPYGCGCVLFKDPSVGRFYKHDSPYTYFSSTELHLGEISLECSRPGAAAVALWATQQLLPLKKDGEFSEMISKGRQAALSLYETLSADDRFIVAWKPELDIIIFAPRAGTVSTASKISRAIFGEAARKDLHLALAELPVTFFDLASAGINADQKTMTCLRSVLMKPEHLEWIDRIWEKLNDATNIVLQQQH